MQFPCNWREVFRLPNEILSSLEYRNVYGGSDIVIGHKNPLNVALLLTIPSSSYKAVQPTKRQRVNPI